MKNALLLTSIVILGMNLNLCKKNFDSIDLKVTLINTQGQEINSFQYGDTTVSFKFILCNNSDKSITYYSDASSACFQFLEVYRKNLTGNYEYIGKPTIYFGGPAWAKKLEANQVALLGIAPIVSVLKWPDLNQGSYYVGNTVTFKLDQKDHNFYSRIYFSVK